MIDNAEDLDIVLPTNDQLEYSWNHFMKWRIIIEAKSIKLMLQMANHLNIRQKIIGKTEKRVKKKILAKILFIDEKLHKTNVNFSLYSLIVTE